LRLLAGCCCQLACDEPQTASQLPTSYPLLCWLQPHVSRFPVTKSAWMNYCYLATMTPLSVC
jgi:hypothetical protein